MQIALFLRNISFVLGSSQVSNVGGVCCVINFRPRSLSLALLLAQMLLWSQPQACGRLQGRVKECAHTWVDRWLWWGELVRRWQKRPGEGTGAFLSRAVELRLDSCLALHGRGLSSVVAVLIPGRDG